MIPRQGYLLRAAELSAKAQAGNDHDCKIEFQNLARAFLRLAEQAERNEHTDIVYETPPKKDGDPKGQPRGRQTLIRSEQCERHLQLCSWVFSPRQQ
jgi:hypothetical protein